jgi:aspartyl-tRNA(Asn)/glutamyl-tRNA(Gln) amidotransferase subunit A
MAGFDERDSTSLQRPKEDYSRSLGRSLKGLRIGLPKQYFVDGVDADVRLRVEEAIRWYESQGAARVEVDLPNAALGVPVYYVIAPAEASSNLSRFDGVRYGHRARSTRTSAISIAARAPKASARGQAAHPRRHVCAVSRLLRRLLPPGAEGAAPDRARFRAGVRALRRADGPVAPSTAFAIGAKTDDPVQMYLGDIFTVPTSLAGLPCLSIPCGFDGKGCRSACS